MITRLEIYDKVNQAESFEELAKVILELADENGEIQGRTRKFNAQRMSDACLEFNVVSPRRLTREFGIRQQAMYIQYYTELQQIVNDVFKPLVP